MTTPRHGTEDKVPQYLYNCLEYFELSDASKQALIAHLSTLLIADAFSSSEAIGLGQSVPSASADPRRRLQTPEAVRPGPARNRRMKRYGPARDRR